MEKELRKQKRNEQKELKKLKKRNRKIIESTNSQKNKTPDK